jgi:HEAT repeat protein
MESLKDEDGEVRETAQKALDSIENKRAKKSVDSPQKTS